MLCQTFNIYERILINKIISEIKEKIGRKTTCIQKRKGDYIPMFCKMMVENWDNGD
jgi:hypothetical protein